MIHPRSLDLREPRPDEQEWICTACETRVPGPWHVCDEKQETS